MDRTAPLAFELEGWTMTPSLVATPGFNVMVSVSVMAAPPTVATNVTVPEVVDALYIAVKVPFPLLVNEPS